MNKSFALIAPMFALILAACGGDETQNAPTASAPSAAPTPAGNVVKVAVEPVYPPFVQPNESNSNFIGLDIEVLTAIAEREGFQVQFTPYPWEGLFNRLNSGEADIVAGGIAATEERKANMDFTDQYEETSVIFAIPKDSTIQNPNELREKVVYYQRASAEEAVLKNLFRLPELDPKYGTESAWLSIKSVISANESKADAAIGQSSTFEYYLSQYKDTGIQLVYNEKLPREQLAFAVKKGNTALLEKLNRGLNTIKNDGTLKQIHDKWIPVGSQHSKHDHAAEHQAASVAK